MTSDDDTTTATSTATLPLRKEGKILRILADDGAAIAARDILGITFSG
ncbi:MAG: hypothetical protein ABI600_15845 [Luteolibacter sp.]